MAGAFGSPWSHWGRAGDFPGDSLGAQALSVSRGVPTPSLDPRRTPASRDKRPSASKGPGHTGPGCEQLADLAAKPQTPPPVPLTAKIPLFFHPVR